MFRDRKFVFLMVGMLTTTIALAMYGHAPAPLLTAEAFDSSSPTPIGQL